MLDTLAQKTACHEEGTAAKAFLQVLLKMKYSVIGTMVLFVMCGCAVESDYPQQAKAFYSKYAKSREVDLLIHYNIKPRNRRLYFQECKFAPEDTTKTWAIFEADDPEAKIELSRLKIALAPFRDSGFERVALDYAAVSDADTLGANGQAIVHVRDAIRAFYRLGMQEVICTGEGVVYLVQEKFMLIHIAEAGRTPESIKNVATKLDENWYYEISLEHQQEQRLKLVNVLREFWSSLRTQQTDTTK